MNTARKGHHMSRRVTAIAALAIAGLALTACSAGGGSGDGDAAGGAYDLVSGGTLTVATE